MATDVGAARVKVTGDVRSFARQTERDLNKALKDVEIDDVEVRASAEKAVSDLDAVTPEFKQSGERAGESFGEGFKVGADGRLRDARGRFVKTGESVGKDTGKAFSEGVEKNTDTRRVESRLKKEFSKSGSGAVKAFASALSAGLSVIPALVGPALITAGVGIAAGIAAAAGPVIGGLIASSIIAAGGLGVIGLGAFLLKEEPALVSAAQKMTSSMKDVFTKAAQPMLKPMIEALGIFEKSATRIGPAFKTAFGAVAPAIAPLAAGFSGLVEEAMPGFIELMKTANPLLQGMAGVLPGLGHDISVFLGNIAASGPGATVFFQDLIKFVGRSLVVLGNFVGWLTDMYPAVKEFFGNLPGVLREAWAAMKEGQSASEVFGILKSAFDPGFFQRVVDAIRNVVTGGFNFLANNVGNIIQTILSARSAVSDAIIGLVTGIVDALPGIIPQVVSSVIGLVNTLVTTLISLTPKLLQAASLLVNSLVDGIIANLPQLIQGATQIVLSLLGGIASLLPTIVQAGLNLIQGLVSGIVAAIPQIQPAFVQMIPVIVQAATQIVTSLLSTIATLLPQLIQAGLMMLQGLVEGFLTAIPQIQLAIIQILPQLMNAVITMLPSIMTLGVNILKAIVQGIGSTLPTVIETVKTQVIPALVNALKTEGPKLVQQGGEAIKQILQGMTDSVSVILDVITTQIIPAITSLLKENPEFITTGLDILMKLLQGMTDNISMITTFITETLIPQITTMIEANLPTIINAGVTILMALLNGLISMIPQLIVVVAYQIVPAIVIALVKAIPQIAAVGVQMMIALGGSLLSMGVDRAKSAMSAVKDAILGFFAGAGSWLAGAGKQIIDGLVSGLRSGFERVRSTLSELTSMLPDWKGPAEVDRKILRESGQLVMEGFDLGINDQRKAIEKSLRSITNDLPGFATGRTRGGDGAAAMVINFEPGSIVINGQGAQAGNDAADAILERLGHARGLM